MKLLIITQKVDKNDENLGAFYQWFEELSKKFDKVTIIANEVGENTLPSHVEVYSLGRRARHDRLIRLWKFWELFSHHFARTDAALFHMIPEFVLAAAPFLAAMRKRTALWYAHGSVTWKLVMAERLVDYVFTSSREGLRIPSKKVVYLGQAINTEVFKPKTLSEQKNIHTYGIHFTATPLNHSTALPHRVSDENSSSHSLKSRKKMWGLITIGRISPVKDYETIIRACGVLKDTWREPWKLSIVGGPLMPRDYDYRKLLVSLVKKLGVGDSVEFIGAQPYSEVPLLLRDRDMFINVSKTGSLDKAVLEAMATGLTVITANEAYKSFLPSRYFLEHITPHFLAERIKALMHEERPNQELRTIVKEHHSLARTMERMSAILKDQEKEFFSV